MSATKKLPGGVTGKGFQPGQSGNPGGRRPSLKTAIARMCGEEGDKLVALWYLVAFGTDAHVAKELRTRRSLRDRMDAARELADRGYGKPVQAVEMTGEDGNPIQVQEIRDSLARKLAGLVSRVGSGSVAGESD